MSRKLIRHYYLHPSTPYKKGCDSSVFLHHLTSKNKWLAQNSSPLPSYSENEPATKRTKSTSHSSDLGIYRFRVRKKKTPGLVQASEYSKGTSDDEYGDPEEDENLQQTQGSCRRRRATRKPLRRGTSGSGGEEEDEEEDEE